MIGGVFWIFQPARSLPRARTGTSGNLEPSLAQSPTDSGLDWGNQPSQNRHLATIPLTLLIARRFSRLMASQEHGQNHDRWTETGVSCLERQTGCNLRSSRAQKSSHEPSTRSDPWKPQWLQRTLQQARDSRSPRSGGILQFAIKAIYRGRRHLSQRHLRRQFNYRQHSRRRSATRPQATSFGAKVERELDRAAAPESDLPPSRGETAPRRSRHCGTVAAFPRRRGCRAAKAGCSCTDRAISKPALATPGTAMRAKYEQIRTTAEFYAG